MYNYIKSIAKAILAPLLRKSSVEKIYPGCIRKTAELGSYSQYQEDLIIDAVLGSKTSGVYVDVGANDPSELSNTLRFYQRGWRGINIEPDPRQLQKFREQRERDINLNIGAGVAAGELEFFQMSANTLSGFDKEAAINNGKRHGATIVSSIKVKVLPLRDIFQEHLPDTPIDFISIDVEGFDLDVLKGNDWNRFRPKVVVIEINQSEKDVPEFLLGVGYREIYCNGTNGIFIRD